ncbi:MAG TPA: sigma 54-interacting transcriptional regulator [Polyangia bacterium]|nr:sigma 54-interacting transcriptional regulator [Polyangia bacterium]
MTVAASILEDDRVLRDELGARRRAEHPSSRERAILDVNNAIISNLTRDTLLAAISRAIARVVPFDRAALTLHDPATDKLRILALEGPLPPLRFPVGVCLDRKDSHVGWVFDHQRTLLRRDLAREAEFAPERRLRDEGIRALLTAPLIVGRQSIGTITLGGTKPNQFDTDDEAFLADVANQVALAVSNMRAFEEIAELKGRLQAENQYLREELRREQDGAAIVGESPALAALVAQIEQVAPTTSTVLITGETGTGKELVARAIHERSPRRDRPLVKVNCGAISAGLVESELFGHVKGAFTGALANREGRFKLAEGGTIFLDEIGEMPLDAQVKLLRVLQEGELEPVGCSKTVRVDVRIIAATNRDLTTAVREGRFRSDLYYRLAIIPLAVPPLRDRRGDVERLVRHFVPRLARRHGKAVVDVPPEVMQGLVAHTWPGNVRELQNTLERAVVLSPDGALALPDDFAGDGSPCMGPRSVAASPTDAVTLDEAERRHIVAALEAKNWLIEGARGAAKALDVHPNTLRGKMRRLGICRPTP